MRFSFRGNRIRVVKQVLIIAGTLDGFSGFILSYDVPAMNRSMTNVLLRLWQRGDIGKPGDTGTMREVSLDDIAVQLAYASKVVFVRLWPGHCASKHAVRELADSLRSAA